MATGATAGTTIIFERGSWWVVVESGASAQRFCCGSEEQAQRFAARMKKPDPAAPLRDVRAPSPPRTAPLPRVRVLKKGGR